MFGISEKIYNFVLYIKNKMIRKKTSKKKIPHICYSYLEILMNPKH